MSESSPICLIAVWLRSASEIILRWPGNLRLPSKRILWSDSKYSCVRQQYTTYCGGLSHVTSPFTLFMCLRSFASKMCTVTVQLLHREHENLLLQYSEMSIYWSMVPYPRPQSVEKIEASWSIPCCFFELQGGGEAESMRGLRWVYCFSPWWKISNEHWYGRNPKPSKRNLPQCHLVCHRFHEDYLVTIQDAVMRILQLTVELSPRLRW
jgi:hypothetical protein